MPLSNPLDILLAHDQWATRQLLLVCEKLTAEQLDQIFEIGPGSLRATITHMLGAMRTWADTLAQRPHRPRPEHSGVRYSPADLVQMLDESCREFAEQARAFPLDQVVRRERGGKEYAFTRGAIVTHVATHGMHHRAQCLNMLRQLGVKPLPPSSVAEWTFQ